MFAHIVAQALNRERFAIASRNACGVVIILVNVVLFV